jgi:hypothetical protein
LTIVMYRSDASTIMLMGDQWAIVPMEISTASPVSCDCSEMRSAVRLW